MMFRRCLSLFSLFVIAVAYCDQPLSADEQKTEGHRVYSVLMDPREHPDYRRYHIQPPHWGVFGDRTHFMTLRGFEMEENRIVNYRAKLDRFTVDHELGNVLGPNYSMLFAENIAEVIDEMRGRGLFLNDIYGYVPGSGPGGFWQQFDLQDGVLEMIEAKLGDHWLGMDNGEQDGRYVDQYARYLVPANASRREQYFNFQRHMERLTDELGNKMVALVSLNYGHYFLKEGLYTLIGAETAQALPNGQVYYAFIRGAGKQYGVPWFGNASVFNRWGFKAYGGVGDAEGYAHGPTKGTSLNLLKRLIYSHLLYNCMVAGFEMQYFDGDALSPVGHIQQSANRWVADYGFPGAMLTPVGVMTDFYAGWAMPRHLYCQNHYRDTQNLYRVWGNMPYEAGDYLMDNVLDLFYPGYQNSSFYHDETGFMSATPYGDCVDGLLSDAPEWLLDRYSVLVIAGELEGGLEIRNKLQRYIERGGQLLITTGSLKQLYGGLAGVAVSGPAKAFAAGASVKLRSQTIHEDQAFELYPLRLPTEAEVIGRCGDDPAVVEVACGAGRVTVMASPFGVGSVAKTVHIALCKNEHIDRPLPKPYPLLEHVRVVLDGVFRQQRLFDAGDHLSLITCRKGPGDYTLGINNNSLSPQPLKIISHCGAIESIEEITLDQSEKTAVGYLPEGFEDASIGKSNQDQIAGGDVRLFSVKVREQGVREIPHQAPPSRPKNRILPLRKALSIKEEILSRPTFFQHFDGVVIDWKYLHEREADALESQSGWMTRQKVRVFVDLTSGLNFYPDLRLINNLERDYDRSMAVIGDVMTKMQAIGARDLILSLHRYPENNFTREQTETAFESTFRELAKQAQSLDVTLYLRPRPDTVAETHQAVLDFISKIGSDRLHLAASTAMLIHERIEPARAKELLEGKVGLWLAGGAAYDIAGELCTIHTPLFETARIEKIRALLAIAGECPVILDGYYTDVDQEYRDIVIVK